MDGHSRLENSGDDKNNIERQNSLDRFLRELKYIKAPRDESLKPKDFNSLMPQKVESSQEYYDPVEHEKWVASQWEGKWDAAMKQQGVWQGRKVQKNLSEQRRSGRHSR